jgi:hypothetical protein
MTFAFAVPALLAAALTAAASAGAHAAERQPSRIPDWKQSHLEEGNVAVQTVYRLAVCARTRRRAAVEALLATAPQSAEESSLARAAMPSGLTDCPIRTRKVSIRSKPFLRGALAEALYNGDGMKPRPGLVLPLEETFRPTSGDLPLDVARWVARCAVRRQPRLAHEIVRWNPGSIGEARALRSLEQAFLGCLPPGERLRASRLHMRAFVAEELYHASVTFKESFANAQG